MKEFILNFIKFKKIGLQFFFQRLFGYCILKEEISMNLCVSLLLFCQKQLNSFSFCLFFYHDFCNCKEKGLFNVLFYSRIIIVIYFVLSRYIFFFSFFFFYLYTNFHTYYRILKTIFLCCLQDIEF